MASDTQCHLAIEQQLRLQLVIDLLPTVRHRARGQKGINWLVGELDLLLEQVEGDCLAASDAEALACERWGLGRQQTVQGLSKSNAAAACPCQRVWQLLSHCQWQQHSDQVPHLEHCVDPARVQLRIELLLC